VSGDKHCRHKPLKCAETGTGWCFSAIMVMNFMNTVTRPPYLSVVQPVVYGRTVREILCSQTSHRTVSPKSSGELKSHLSFSHEIGVEWHECPHCEYKAKAKSNLARHIRNKHGIGVIWQSCPNCDFKAKTKSEIKSHLANTHNIGATWHSCPHCEYTCKLKGNLSKHIQNKHDPMKTKQKALS